MESAAERTEFHRIGFIGLGVMGLPMARNVSERQPAEVVAYDLSEERRGQFEASGGKIVSDVSEIYEQCDLILQILPTHETILGSIDNAIRRSRPGTIVVDLSSAAPDLLIEAESRVRAAGLHLLDSPVSGGNPMAQAGTLSIMAGGEREIYERVEPVLRCMGTPVYTGEAGSGATIKLINNMIGGAMLAVMAESYALAERAGLDLETVYQATRGGFAGSPLYDNKIPKVIARDFEPGARIAVHYKDILNARAYAETIGMELPVTDQVYEIMRWMVEQGYQDEDQAALIRYYEERFRNK